jgi:hypothetical protein
MKSEVMRQSTGADVIPAKAGIQMCRRGWMPAPYRSTGQAYAGMTDFPLLTGRLHKTEKLVFFRRFSIDTCISKGPLKHRWTQMIPHQNKFSGIPL